MTQIRGNAAASGQRRADVAGQGRAEAERRGRLCHAVDGAGESYRLSTAERSILRALATGERTWVRVADLKQAGLNGSTSSTLAGLVERGWVEEFPTEDGAAATLSCWAAETLGLDQEEHWEYYPGTIDQEDSSGERTSSRVRQPHECPRWELRPGPREPGMPKLKPKPIKLPARFHLSFLPVDVIIGLIPRAVPSALDDAIANEERKLTAERERFLEQEARTETGQLDVDPESGRVRVEPVTLWAPAAEDGLRGGVGDTRGGKVPIDPRLGKARKPGKKKRRNGKRPA
jgi:hypothetical protein